MDVLLSVERRAAGGSNLAARRIRNCRS